MLHLYNSMSNHVIHVCRSRLLVHINLLKPSGQAYCIYRQPTMHLCLYACQKKQRVLPYTELSDLFL